jgi:uncharacterized protein (TIGR02466 family)
MGNITLIRSEMLFPSPMFLFQIAEAEPVNRMLLEEVSAIRAKSPGVNKSNKSGWHSETDFFRRTEPGCQALRAYVIEAVRHVISKLSPKFDFDSKMFQAEGWFNVNPRGAFNRPHGHPGFAVSGTYWVKIPSGPAESGAFEFLDPRVNANAMVIEGAACFQRSLTLQPKAGWMMIFPSYLNHWVYPNERDEERVSMAFNVRYGDKPPYPDTSPQAKTE